MPERKTISRAALTLGSAVAIAGLAAAMPAQAATGGMCSGAKTTKSSKSGMSNGSGMAKGSAKSKSGMCSSK